MSLNKYIDKIKQDGITKEIVSELISEHKTEHEHMKNQYLRSLALQIKATIFKKL